MKFNRCRRSRVMCASTIRPIMLGIRIYIFGGNMFCTSCGSQQPNEATFCSSCGTATQAAGQFQQRFVAPPVQPGYQQPYQQFQNPPKSKTTAVLLAVFLGCWAWLYTYKFDATKFWLSFGLGFVLFFLNFVLFGIGFLGLGFTIWAIVDAATRTDQWYATYWNRPVQ